MGNEQWITASNPPGVPTPRGGWFSHAVSVDVGPGALLFVSGQAALDEADEIVGPGDVEVQSEQVFATLDRILAAHGATFDDVVSLRTYVADMEQIAAYGEVRARYVTGWRPTSTTIEVSRLFHREALVEVDLVAAIPAGRSARGH